MIEKVRLKMAELDFVTQSYGRAYMVADATKGSRIPAIHEDGAGYDYKDMLPRDSVDSFSFIYVSGRYTPQNFDTNNYSIVNEVPFDVIFFGDLRKITPAPHDIATDEFAEATVKKLAELNGLKVTQVDEQNREVYSQFSAEVESKFFMWPFSLFRIRCTWNFEYECS